MSESLIELAPNPPQRMTISLSYVDYLGYLLAFPKASPYIAWGSILIRRTLYVFHPSFLYGTTPS